MSTVVLCGRTSRPGLPWRRAAVLSYLFHCSDKAAAPVKIRSSLILVVDIDANEDGNGGRNADHPGLEDLIPMPRRQLATPEARTGAVLFGGLIAIRRQWHDRQRDQGPPQGADHRSTFRARRGAAVKLPADAVERRNIAGRLVGGLGNAMLAENAARRDRARRLCLLFSWRLRLGFLRRLELANGAFELLQLFGDRGIRQPGLHGSKLVAQRLARPIVNFRSGCGCVAIELGDGSVQQRKIIGLLHRPSPSAAANVPAWA